MENTLQILLFLMIPILIGYLLAKIHYRNQYHIKYDKAKISASEAKELFNENIKARFNDISLKIFKNIRNTTKEGFTSTTYSKLSDYGNIIIYNIYGFNDTLRELGYEIYISESYDGFITISWK